MDIKQAITSQKRIARASIASKRLQMPGDSSATTLSLLNAMAQDKKFLNSDFSIVNSIDGLIELVHIRHTDAQSECAFCVKLAEELMQPEEEEATDILPRFGNLISILEQEVAQEKQRVESRRIPSQNDLTRWALKDAVLEYYQGLHFPEDVPVVNSRYDDRLIADLAPDFDVISNLWLQKLDELKRREDKYALIIEEFDKAENDLLDGMRGSAFEKQLDRYREEFMQKLVR